MFNTRGPHAGSPRGVLVPVVRTAKTLNTLSRTGGDSMKAYLITTGTLFGLFAAMHLVRVVEILVYLPRSLNKSTVPLFIGSHESGLMYPSRIVRSPLIESRGLPIWHQAKLGH